MYFCIKIVVIFVETKLKDMKKQEFTYRGSRFNKVYFSDIEDRLEDKGFDVDECYRLMADENECVYVSCGFLSALAGESIYIQEGEWHHYFKRDSDGDFEAFKMYFNS